MNRSLLLKLNVNPSPLWVIFEINFFRNLAVASLTAIMALYFKKLIGSDVGVGIIYFTGYLCAFFSNLYSSRIVEHLKKRKSLLVGLVGTTIIFAGFAIAKHAAIVFFLFAVYQFIVALIVLDIGLYIKHYSNLKNIAGNIGKLGSFGNIGWIVGPFLGSLIANQWGFEAVFFFSSAISMIGLLTFFFIRLKNEDVNFQHSRPFLQNIGVFFKTPNLRRTYVNHMGLGFIYSIWDYLPLLMTGLGATIPIIGLTKTLMGVPQSIFEFPIGKIADTQTGERKIFMIGYAITAAATALLGIVTGLKLFIVIFFIAAIGSSFLEMTRDSYFFRQISEHDVELISVYRTSDTIPYLLGQGMAIVSLSFMPLNYWFIFGGMAAFLIFTINAYKLKDLRRSA